MAEAIIATISKNRYHYIILLHLRAIVSRVNTIKYSEEELKSLPIDVRKAIEYFGEEKVVAEEHVATMDFINVKEMRKKIIALCDLSHPIPIVIRAEGITDTFLIGKRYFYNDPDALFEIFIYDLNEHARNKLNQQVALNVLQDADIQKAKQKSLKEQLRLAKKIINEASIRTEKESKQMHTNNSINNLLKGNIREVARIIGKDMNQVSKHQTYFAKLHPTLNPRYNKSNLLYHAATSW